MEPVRLRLRLRLRLICVCLSFSGVELFHRGTDGGRFDFAEARTLDGHRYGCLCPLNELVDLNQTLTCDIDCYMAY